MLTVDGSEYFTIAMHHGGYFSSTRSIYYMQGEIDFFDLCEGDRMSLIELQTMAAMLGQKHGSIEFYWKFPSSTLDSDLRLIKNEVDIMEMCRNVPTNRYIYLFT